MVVKEIPGFVPIYFRPDRRHSASGKLSNRKSLCRVNRASSTCRSSYAYCHYCGRSSSRRRDYRNLHNGYNHSDNGNSNGELRKPLTIADLVPIEADGNLPF